MSVTEAGRSDTGLTQYSVVIDAAPASGTAFGVIDTLRESVHGADDGALVGGPDAQALDARNAAQRDQRVVIPAILAVVLLVLYVLLRAALAPVVLVAVTVLSALAALGLGGWASVHVFGFPALDNTTPLFAILFLVALGVDYTIFLVTRAREETHAHGTREGIVRAVAATGGVITSAGIVLGGRVRRSRCVAADRAHPDRHHRRSRHPAGHLPGAHGDHSLPLHPHRAQDLVAGPRRPDRPLHE